MWPRWSGELPNLLRRSHSQPVGKNEAREAPNTQSLTQTSKLRSGAVQSFPQVTSISLGISGLLQRFQLFLIIFIMLPVATFLTKVPQTYRCFCIYSVAKGHVAGYHRIP